MNIDKKSLITGLILILIGAVILGNNLGLFYISWDTFWPWFMIAGGVLFLISWLADRAKYGLLMPASILIIYGVLFLYSAYDHWWSMERLWPFFIIGPGVGFLMMYIFGQRESGLLVPGFILTGLGIVFLMGEGTFRLFLPLLIIFIGVLLLIKGRKKEQPGLPSGEEIQTTPDGEENAEELDKTKDEQDNEKTSE